MARASKSSDEAYNARRREYRAAQRYLKRAAGNVGIMAERDKALAREHILNALETYDPTAPAQKISSQIVNTAAELGIDVLGERGAYVPTVSDTTGIEGEERALERQARAIDRSLNALETTLQDEQTRSENEARALLNSETIGKRVIGGLSDVWRDKVSTGASAEDNRAAIESAIFGHFNTDNWVDTLQAIEDIVGEDLYKIASDSEIYELVKLMLQKDIIENTVVE